MKRISTYFAVVLAILAAVVSTVPVSAASSSGLSINPRRDYVLQPGKSATDKLTIGNLDKKNDLNITLKVIDFTFQDESGTPKLMLAANAPQTSWSLKPFLTVPQSVVVPAGQTKTISINVKVPSDQGAGSYYSAIEYAASGVNGGNVSLNASGVTLAFLSVPGVVKENMSITKFGSFLPDKTNTSGAYQFISTNNSPYVLAYTLKNSGNVAEAPAGNIIVKNMFGKTVANITDANPRKSLALIGQTRRFQACINPVQKQVNFEGAPTTDFSCAATKLMPGRYSASLDAFYGQNGNNTHEITSKATFWYLPLWFIIAFIVLILIIGAAVWWLVRKIKKATGGRSQMRKR